MIKTDKLFKLEQHHLESLIKKGYAEVTLPSGETITIDQDDIVFKVDEIRQLTEMMRGGQLNKN